MSFGLTPEGFVRKRLRDILDSLRTNTESVLGPIDMSDTGVFGKIYGVAAEQMAQLWEEIGAILLGLYPASAEGVQLDNVAQLVGLARIAAGNSTSIISASGTQGTVVPLGTDFSVATEGDVFESDAAVTIDKANAIRLDISVSGVADNEDYTVSIAGTDHTIDSGGSATAITIAAALVAELTSAQVLMVATDNLDGTFFIQSTDLESGFNTDVSATGAGALTIDTLATPIATTANDTGPILGLAGTITVIDTPVSGLDSVTNLEDAIIGRDVETDVELRLRIQAARQGFATDEAIRSRLLDEVPGVSSVTIISNRTDTALPSGQPPHSYSAIVQGGTDQAVADKLFEVQPSGIASFGTESEVVVDSQGNNQVINFSRPTNEFAWVKVIYTLHPEDTFPTDGATAIKNAIIALGATFEPGQDLLVQQLVAAVWNVPGLQSVVVTIDVTVSPGGPPTYVATDIATDSDTLLLFDAARIPVSEAP
ncbi:MAG: baseplate J/gp47 family protein [Candidatus Hydrogenedentes bacterium]|nr:baseplate J/gp47 family protein [Candidatus Hydrogenedentota bacterium]